MKWIKQLIEWNKRKGQRGFIEAAAALDPEPISKAILAGILGAGSLAKLLQGKAHYVANDFTSKYQTPIGNDIIKLVDQFNKTGDKSILNQVNDKWNTLNGFLGTEISGGGDKSKVGNQAVSSLSWIPQFLNSQGINAAGAGSTATQPSQPSQPSAIGTSRTGISPNGGSMDFSNFINSFSNPGGNGSTPPYVGTNPSISAILGQILGGVVPTIPGLPGRSSNPGIPNNLPGAPGTSGSNSNDTIAALLAALSGVAGGLNNRPGTTSTVPTFDPAINPLRNQTIAGYTDLLKDPDLTGYTASGVSNINHQAQITQQNEVENLANRGIIGGPAVATALNSVENNRGNQITSFQNGIPLLKNQLQTSNLGAVGNFINANRGSNITSPGNIAGGAVSGSAGLLAYLYGLGKL